MLGDVSRGSSVPSTSPPGQRFVVEFPNVSRSTIPYIHHFISFCSRFLVYSNDGEGNPFQEELVPLAVQHPALLYAMAAVAAGHLSRSQRQHQLAAAKHYSMALRGLSEMLHDMMIAKSDATLGTCLLLCIYEVGFFSPGQNTGWLTKQDGPFGKRLMATTSEGSSRFDPLQGRSKGDGLPISILLPTRRLEFYVCGGRAIAQGELLVGT